MNKQTIVNLKKMELAAKGLHAAIREIKNVSSDNKALISMLKELLKFQSVVSTKTHCHHTFARAKRMIINMEAKS